MRKVNSSKDCLINAFYICILDMLRSSGAVTIDDYKFRTVEDFLQNPDYNIFAMSSIPIREKQLLWMTANWMSIFFKMVPSKGNMGLGINVVSKLLEGWDGNLFFIFTSTLKFDILMDFVYISSMYVWVYIHHMYVLYVCM